MEEEIDPYEQQLLAVFKSCDSDGCGVLDKAGFNKLCDALQLEENRRNQLTARLCNNEKCSVAFPQFRDALLAVLAALKSPTEEFSNQSTSFDISEDEVTPKFVFGGKKYGRRSRPTSDDQDEDKGDECFTPTEIGDVFAMETEFKKSKDGNDMQTSEEEGDFEIEALCKYLGVCKDRTISTSELISICSSLAIPKSIYDIIQENIAELKTHNMDSDMSNKTDLTYEQLFQIVKNSGYLTSNSATIGICLRTPFSEDRISNVDINSSGCMNYDALVNMLENAGINDAGVFLNDLGISPQFDVNLSELAMQLHEELINVQRCIDSSSSQLHTLLNPHLLLLQASVVVNQAQIKWYKSCMEQIQCERDKLRNDLMIANERANLLAQEVDDNHARMENSVQQKLKLLEQKHADQIKKLTYQWTTERDQLTNQNIKMEKQLEQLLYDETRLRIDVASLKQDYENLEKDNRNLLDQLVNAENTKEELEREIQRLSLLKKKVLELESSNEQAISFLEKMNLLQAENTMLRDKNDELVVELENITLKQMQNRTSCSKRRGLSPLEGEENSDTDVGAISTHRMYSKVRKYSTEKDLFTGLDRPQSEALNSGVMTQCESGVEADISTSSSSLDRLGEAIADANDKMIFQLRSRVSFLEKFIRKYQLKVPDYGDDIDGSEKFLELHDRTTDDLEKQCETLQQRLDQVQKEILKLLSEKRACSEENCALKNEISELMKYLPSPDVKHILGASANSSLETIQNDNSWSRQASSEDYSNSETLKADWPVDKKILSDSEALKYVENEYRSLAEGSNTPERHSVLTQTNTSSSSVFQTVSEEGSEMEWKTISDDRKSSGSFGDDEGISEESQSSTKFTKLVQDYNRLTLENKTLKEKCDELGSCLDMLRNEYDQCEEYWASKLDDERKLFEEEQRINDEKFVELQQKIEEYSEMYGAEAMASQMAFKLPPIAENDNLEKEVNDLQEEFQMYKEKMESESREKQREIERLKQIIGLYETTGNLKHSDRGIERSLESIKSDKTYVLEKPSLDLQEMPRLNEDSLGARDPKCAELKQWRKQLKRDCNKLERDKDVLLEQIIKMQSDFNRAPLNFASYHRPTPQQLGANGMLHRLRQQEMKNRHLRNLLLQQQKKLNKTMRKTLEQHEKELEKYRSALTSSQEMWQSLQETSKKQAEQIVMSDVLVKELYCENSQLMATIHQLEQQHLDCPSPVLL